MAYDYGSPPDVEDVVVAWLSAMGAAATQRLADDTLPFFLVTRVAGGDDLVWDYPTVDVDVFAADRNTANLMARTAHRRMISLRPNDVITLPTGGTASVDRVQTEHGPRFVTWDVGTISRYVMRYRIDLRLDRAGGS